MRFIIILDLILKQKYVKQYKQLKYNNFGLNIKPKTYLTLLIFLISSENFF